MKVHRKNGSRRPRRNQWQGKEFKGAAEVLRACEEELDVGVLEVRFVLLRGSGWLGHIFAHDRLHAMGKQRGFIVHGQLRARDELQRRIQGR